MLRPVPVAALLLGALALLAAPAEAVCVSDPRWRVGAGIVHAEQLGLESSRAPLHEHFMGDPRRVPDHPALDELEVGEDQTCARRPHRRQDDPRKPVRRYPRPDRQGARPRSRTSRKAVRRCRPRVLMAWLAAIRPPAPTPRGLTDGPARPP